jgi:hypothetical protein
MFPENAQRQDDVERFAKPAEYPTGQTRAAVCLQRSYSATGYQEEL